MCKFCPLSSTLIRAGVAVQEPLVIENTKYIGNVPLQTICTDNGMDTSSGSVSGSSGLGGTSSGLHGGSIHGHHSGAGGVGGGHDVSGLGAHTPAPGGLGGLGGSAGMGVAASGGSMKSALQNFNSLSSRM